VSTTFSATDVAVVIPTQNRWDVLERTIIGLRGQTAAGFEIIVVVDEAPQLPSFLDDVHVVYRRRRGVGAARNDGVRATDRAIIMFLGDDTIPEPDLIARHVDMHRRHPEIEVGVLGSVQWHPEVANGRFQRWLDWSGTQFEYHTIVGDEAGWGRLYTSNVTLKRSLYEKVGGFDEEFLFGYEDIELGLRLDEAGLRLLYEPHARVSHVHRYDMAAIERRFRLVGGGEYLMTRKHPDFPPYFLRKLLSRPRVAPFSPWPWLVDYVPTRPRALRRAAEVRADAWYSKRLAAPLVAGWLAAEELDELGEPPGLYEAVAAEHLAEQRWLGDVLHLVPPGATVLAAACSTTMGRELVAAGYDVTFIVSDEDDAEGVRRRLKRRELEAPTVSLDELDGAAAFDVALAFRIDLAAGGHNLLDAAERHSTLVAASAHVRAADEVESRAKSAGVVLHLSDDDETALIVYRGRRAGGRVDRPALEGLREGLARQAARTGRRRPWVPVPQGTQPSPD